MDNKEYNIFISNETKEDMHIHPRPYCFSIDVMCRYVNLCMELGIVKIGFVEHGRRVSKIHQGVLNNENDMLKFVKCLSTVKAQKKYNDIEIKCGIEIDYSSDPNFVLDMLQQSAKVEGLDYIIGSVHGFDRKSYKEYIFAVLDLISNYKIDVLGHFRLSEDIDNYWNEIFQILDILQNKQIKLELNKAKRYNCGNIELKKQFLTAALTRNISFSFGSDAHSYTELIINNSQRWLC